MIVGKIINNTNTQGVEFSNQNGHNFVCKVVSTVFKPVYTFFFAMNSTLESEPNIFKSGFFQIKNNY